MVTTGNALSDGVMRGEVPAMARAISLVESGGHGFEALLDAIFPHTGRGMRVGVTGPPGAGKSTLSSKLAGHYLAQGRSVGILAVDPTSPFTGGAILGDRVRMGEVALEGRLFIRSFATQGCLGGLSRAIGDAADILDAAGKDIIIIETVGVGQSELDIAGAADITIVVLVPESGDGVQAMKAGLMEIAHLFVINKSDRPGADEAAAAINAMVHFGANRDTSKWIPPVLKTAADRNLGIDKLAEAIDRYRGRLSSGNDSYDRRYARLRTQVSGIVEERCKNRFWNADKLADLNQGMNSVMARRKSPFALAGELLGAG